MTSVYDQAVIEALKKQIQEKDNIIKMLQEQQCKCGGSCKCKEVYNEVPVVDKDASI